MAILRWRDILPGIFQGTPWRNGYWGSRWLWTVGLFGDAVFDGIQLAVRSRHLAGEKLAPDALPVHGAERSIARRAGYGTTAGETDAQYAARLRDAWAYWQSAGGVQRMQDEIRGLGFPSATVFRPAHRGGTWSRLGPNGESQYWSIFWVLIYPGDPGSVQVEADIGEWDDGDTWDSGSIWEGGPYLATLRDTARALKPITWVGEIIILLNGASISGDGTTITGDAVIIKVP